MNVETWIRGVIDSNCGWAVLARSHPAGALVQCTKRAISVNFRKPCLAMSGNLCQQGSTVMFTLVYQNSVTNVLSGQRLIKVSSTSFMAHA